MAMINLPTFLQDGDAQASSLAELQRRENAGWPSADDHYIEMFLPH
jgi:hypothetical protein